MYRDYNVRLITRMIRMFFFTLNKKHDQHQSSESLLARADITQQQTTENQVSKGISSLWVALCPVG